ADQEDRRRRQEAGSQGGDPGRAEGRGRDSSGEAGRRQEGRAAGRRQGGQAMKRSLFIAAVLVLGVPGWFGAAPPADPPDEPPAPERTPKPGPVEPPSPGALDDAIRRGFAFLLKDQNKDGSWGTPERTKGLDIYAPVPGAHHAFQTAVTSLCIAALIEAGGDSDEVRKAIERGEEWLFERLPKLRRATPDALYNVWGHGYAIQALARMHQRLPNDAERQEKIKKHIREQMDWLARY